MIPSTPLEVKAFDFKSATLDEMTLFLAPDELEPGEQVAILRRFCLEHTNWTRRQVGGLTAEEIPAVIREIAAKFSDAAIPKASAPSSGNGRGENPNSSPDGSTG